MARGTAPMGYMEKWGLISWARKVGITLNGEAAGISGAKCTFATVWQREGIGQVEFSWSAVKRILDKGGDFKA